MRKHIEHVLAAVGAVIFALFVSYFSTGPVWKAPVHQSGEGLKPIAAESGSISTSTLPNFNFSTSTLGELFHAPLSTTEPLPPAKVVKPTIPTPKPSVQPPIPKPTPKPATTTPTTTPVVQPSPAPTTTTPTQTPSGELAVLKGAIVNIICISHVSPLRSISGSGVFIDSRGIILTVSHVAQMMLLEQYLGSDKISCAIRMGSPAKSMYVARPIYVSEEWLKDNPTTLISSSPTGTGENDFALLAVTHGVNGFSLPGAFPAVTVSKGIGKVGDTVDLGTYGAQNLTGAEVRSSLHPTLVTATIKNRYTFDTNTVDVLALSGTAASQEGSSGGAVTSEGGELLGIITTSQTTGDISARETRSITTSHIRRSFTADTGKDFDSYFGDTSITTLVNVYAPTVQTLGQFLAHATGLE